MMAIGEAPVIEERHVVVLGKYGLEWDDSL